MNSQQMKILSDMYAGGTAYNWIAFYHPIITLNQPPILTLAKKPSMELIPVYAHQKYNTDQTFVDFKRDPVPQMSKAKKLCYGSMLLVSRATSLQRVVDKNIIDRGFQVISKLIRTGSQAADNWRNKLRSDLRGSVDKKGGSTKRTASGLHTSSTRVSTKRLSTQLASYGLCIKDVVGDGNCLFRSLSDQMIGDSTKHLEYRNKVTSYIFDHSEDFKPFFSEHDNFQKSIMALSKPGTFAGNEALVAFVRIYSVDIVIHQLNQSPWRIRADFKGDQDFNDAQQSIRHCQSMLLMNEATDSQINKRSNRSLSQEDITHAARGNKETHELHICYHSYPHYSSVRLIGDARGKTPTMIRLSELFEKYPGTVKAKPASSDQNSKKIPKLVKLSSVMSSPATAEAESESAVTRRILAAVDI